MAHHVQWSPSRTSDDDVEPLVNSQSTKLRFEQDVYTVLPKTRKAWRTRLGTANLLTLVLGTAIIIILYVCLGVFWAQCLVAIRGGRPFIAWWRFVEAGWVTKAITLSTALLRAILSVQAGLFTSTMAALVLERVGATIADVPSLSVMRAVKSPPYALLNRKLMRSAKSWRLPLHWLAIVEILATLATPFLSTLLISDFGNAVIRELPSSIAVASSYTSSINGVQDYWAMPLLGNWRFGENSESFMTGAHFHDTGHAYRAFLPLLDDGERENLREFHGLADVLDTRVVCLSPGLSDLVLTLESPTTFAFRGSMNFDVPYPMPNNTHKIVRDQPAGINCPMVSASNRPNDTAPNQTSLCDMVNSTVLLDAPLVDPATTSDDMGGAELRASRFFLIADFIPDTLDFEKLGERANLTVANTDGPWSIIADPSGDSLIRASACFINLGSNVFNVTMHSSMDGPEPLTRWDREANSYNTIASRRQLGVSRRPESLEDRGLLQLEPRDSWGEIDVTQFSAIPTFYANYGRYFEDIANAMSRHLFTKTSGPQGSGVFLSNSTLFDDSAHVSHVALFQDSLRATDSPALALQALLTRVCQLIYYYRLDRAPPIGPATAVFSSNVLIPTRWTGFVVATLISAIQLCVLATVTVVFIWRTDKSDLGGLWQAVAQIVTRDTQPIFERSSNLRDEDVKRWVQSEHPELSGIHILQRRENDTIGIGLKNKDI